jgi:HEAT repeat protein
MAFVKKLTQPAGGQALSTLVSTPAELIAQLSDADPLIRRWAARDLLPYPETSSALVSHLQSELDRSVREVILTSLTRMGGAVAVAGLVQCLRSEDAHLRNEAIEAMKALPVEVAPIMDALLVDDDADVRIMAVNILESLRHPQVELWLLDVIDNDLVINVCGTAVDLLGEVGSAASLEPLLRLKQRFLDEPYIQFATDLALKRIGKA